MKLKSIIIQSISLIIGVLIGYMIVEYIIKPQSEPKKTIESPKYEPEYIIYHNDNTGTLNKLYCDSFQFRNPYWLEYYYKGHKIQLASTHCIGVARRNEY
jgi:hypothetical protein